MENEKKNSLLIVDDDNSNLLVLSEILGDEYTIYTALSGESAIEIAKKILPDLILLDIIMPKMDGYNTLSEIKKCEITQKIPVIFITNLNSAESEEKGLSLEAVDYIVKPFSNMIVKLRVRNQIQLLNQMRTIEHISLYDQLTNIPNRRNFDGRLNMEWSQAIREKTYLSILIMDLDKFKDINDAYGHQQGDLVLKAVANIFSGSLRRAGDFVARWGGEEFVILLPNTHFPGAMEVAEGIRDNVEKTSISGINGQKINITVSIGVNTVLPQQESSCDEFISKADTALYTAKQTGRNMVLAAEISGA